MYLESIKIKDIKFENLTNHSVEIVWSVNTNSDPNSHYFAVQVYETADQQDNPLYSATNLTTQSILIIANLFD